MTYLYVLASLQYAEGCCLGGGEGMQREGEEGGRERKGEGDGGLR